MKQRIEEITVTVGAVTKEFQVIASDVAPNKWGFYKFMVRVKEAGMYKSPKPIEAKGFKTAAETYFHQFF